MNDEADERRGSESFDMRDVTAILRLAICVFDKVCLIVNVVLQLASKEFRTRIVLNGGTMREPPFASMGAKRPMPS